MRTIFIFMILLAFTVSFTGCQSLDDYLAPKSPESGAHIEMDRCADLEHRVDDPSTIDGKFLYTSSRDDAGDPNNNLRGLGYPGLDQ